MKTRRTKGYPSDQVESQFVVLSYYVDWDLMIVLTCVSHLFLFSPP
jgi:hypothetical protein